MDTKSGSGIVFQNMKTGELCEEKDIVHAFLTFYNMSKRKGEEPATMSQIKKWRHR